MRKFLNSFYAPAALFGIVVLACASLVFAQGTAFNNGRGAFRGDVYVPSVFNLWFGDNTSTDAGLAKNGSYNIGVNGHLGGTSSTANTTTSPAGPWAFGVVTLSSNTATVTFNKAFTATPVCVATDQTTAQLVKSAPTTTTVVLSDTVGASDVVAYACFGNPN